MEFLETSDGVSTDISMETGVIQDLCSITDELNEEGTTERLVTPGSLDAPAKDVDLAKPAASVLAAEDTGEDDSEKENCVERAELQVEGISQGDGGASAGAGEIIDDTNVSDIVSDIEITTTVEEKISKEETTASTASDKAATGETMGTSKDHSVEEDSDLMIVESEDLNSSADSDNVKQTEDSGQESVVTEKVPERTAPQLTAHLAKVVNSPKENGGTDVKDFVQKLTKKELVRIIQDKIIEAISVHSNVGQLNQKLLETEAQKDKLVSHVVGLQKQVKELMRAIKTVTENSGRGQQNRGNQPIRFYRSVGAQVVLDSPVVPLSNGFSDGKVLEARPKPVLKSGNNNNNIRPLATLPTNGIVTSVNGTSNPSLKRPITYPALNAIDAVNGNIGTDAQGNKIRRIVNGNANPAMVQRVPVSAFATPNTITLSHLAPRPTAVRAIAPAGPPKANVVVDLTKDDDAPSTTPVSRPTVVASSPMVVNASKSGNLVMTNNGLVRLISPPYLSGSLQIVQNGSQDGRPILLPAGSLQRPQLPRQIIPQSPVMVRQMTASPAKPGQPVIRSILPKTSTTNTATTVIGSVAPGTRLMPPTVTMSPIAAKAASPMITRTSPNTSAVIRPGGNVPIVGSVRPMGRAPDPPRKFILPPLPPPAVSGTLTRSPQNIPPRPELSLKEQSGGIVLSWTLKLNSSVADIQTYQIYACQEPLVIGTQQKAASWKKVGDVKALPLPMACTLSQFLEDNRYHFIVRGVDIHNRTGPFCEAAAITLGKKQN